MLNDTAENIGTDPISPATTDVATETEQKLTTEIAQLWAIHVDTQSAVKKTQAELKVVRQNLGERLHAMKQLLARPGRAGQWSAFLAAHQISRTTADRLVLAHQKSLDRDGNGTDGAYRDITEEEAAQIAKAVWSRLEKKLGTRKSVFRFLSQIIIQSGIGHESFEDGIMAKDPSYVEPPMPDEPTTSDNSEKVWEVF